MFLHKNSSSKSKWWNAPVLLQKVWRMASFIKTSKIPRRKAETPFTEWSQDDDSIRQFIIDITGKDLKRK